MEGKSLNLCQYKDMFGKPNEGIRKTLRLFDISLVDTIPTIFLGLLLSKLLHTNKFNGILVAFILSIIFHKVFCVDSTIIKLLRK